MPHESCTDTGKIGHVTGYPEQCLMHRYRKNWTCNRLPRAMPHAQIQEKLDMLPVTLRELETNLLRQSAPDIVSLSRQFMSVSFFVGFTGHLQLKATNF